MRPILSCCLALVVASAAAHAITYRDATTALITKLWDANPPGEVLFREDFGAGNLDHWKPDQGWSIVDRPEGDGKCARVVSSEKDNEDLILARHVPITPAHPIVVCWRTRFVSGGEPLHLRVDFFDAEGKTGKPYARQDTSREGRQWTENAMLVSDWFPAYTREITIWFHHNPGANTTSLLSDIRIVDLGPAATALVAAELPRVREISRQLVRHAAGLPPTPLAQAWRQLIIAEAARADAALAACAQM